MATQADCVNAAVRAGATVHEAQGIVRQLFAEKNAMQDTGALGDVERRLAQRVRDAAEAERIKAMVMRKQEVLILRRGAEVESAINTMRQEGAGFSDALEALMVGSSGRFSGSRSSVDARKSGIRKEWSGGVVRELEKLDGALDLLRKDQDFGRRVHAEMLAPGSGKDHVARGVAEIFTRYLENMRLRCNDAGANIGKLTDYAPQSHNAERLLKTGEQRWVDFVEQRLDFERSFPGITDPVERRAILGEVYQNIVTGQGQATCLIGENTRYPCSATNLFVKALKHIG